MADNSKRSVAEKLAAAKRKHKAYLKEKALKNDGNKPKEQETDNVAIQHHTASNDSDITHMENALEVHQKQYVLNENVESHDNVQTDNSFEADLPLPQYSMDNNHQASALPDPLSFFDNFNYSNVGATFQNFAQPLTSFFNNSNKNELDGNIETPNQILIEDNTVYNVNLGNENKTQTVHNSVQMDLISPQSFSYDRFKVDAINVPREGVNYLGNKDLTEKPVFDEFTNSIGSSIDSKNPFPNSETSENLEVPETVEQSNVPELVLNSFQSTQELSNTKTVQENTPFLHEETPNLELVANDEYRNMNCNIKVKNGSSEENDSKLLSSSQSIQNLSKEMKEYLHEEQQFLNHQNLKCEEGVEKRNQELLCLIEQQNVKCYELSQKLYESEMKYAKLATDYRNLEMKKQQVQSEMKSEENIAMVNDLTKLREDLQCHLQTIGMLVAEKTELTSLLQETQSALRNESSQCIDLQNEIKELKIYYSDLENELHLLKSERMNLDSTQKEQGQIYEKIRIELEETKRNCEEHTQDLSECREKLKAVTESNGFLQKQIQELSGQLSMANIKIQQLTLEESSLSENQIHKWMDEKASYEKQICMLNDTLKAVSKEREESSLQYQQYAEQLNDQISNLVQRLEQQQKENEQLKIQEENRVRHIGDLEKQLQNVQNDNTSYNLQRNNSFLKKELESSTELAQSLQTEKEQLNMNLTKALIDKEMLSKELEGCKHTLAQLESTVEQLRGSQPDNAVLLATMESDKVAASRAISQNNELKKQMEGMQEVMFKVNNDNVQLTESVSLERKTNKELLEKLQKTEISFQTLADAIEIKDKELVYLRDQIESMNRQIVHQEQLSDRLRHYEAQTHSSPSLQVELQEAKQMIAHLTNELNILKRNQLNQTSQMNQTVPIDQVHQMNQTVSVDQVSQLNQTNKIEQITQNTQTNTHSASEINVQQDSSSNVHTIEELRTQLDNLQIRNKELESLLQNVQSKEQKMVDSNGNETLDKETAMLHLEKKFLRTMEEIARLTEEKQRLEHLVLQLQGETETIGEYVTLYQQQRSILKQRALEKDEQLQQLNNDRETIKANLDRLNNLVKKLIIRKGAIPKELLDQHEHFSKDRTDLCTEHQKIHQEINRITSNGLNNSEVIDNSNTEIAEEIITLLSEIKSSNLVQPNDEGLHHCPWCSGKLITV
ncbi:golgin subfamily A member 2 [Coccinella septempunctata]|uniref:golgin subfamily A member 2 n=1 Tax=Coccinella septempunctata TaxID=41139 RepID=UPI001D095F00|nr:golgin subfamily A member 2 [Coccinella septempunctata]